MQSDNRIPDSKFGLRSAADMQTSRAAIYAATLSSGTIGQRIGLRRQDCPQMSGQFVREGGQDKSTAVGRGAGGWFCGDLTDGLPLTPPLSTGIDVVFQHQTRRRSAIQPSRACPALRTALSLSTQSDASPSSYSTIDRPSDEHRAIGCSGEQSSCGESCPSRPIMAAMAGRSAPLHVPQAGPSSPGR